MVDILELRDFAKDDFSEFVLCADVSGTNTTVGIAGVRGGSVLPLFGMRFKTRGMSDICPALNETLKVAAEKFNITVSKACISAAGPVDVAHARCKLTNADLVVDAQEILAGTMLGSVALINDFEAVGFGVQFLDVKSPSDILAVPRSSPAAGVSGCVKAVVGAGTGLGKSILVFDRGRGLYFPLPSEGGHADFGALDPFEIELSNYIRNKRGGGGPVELESLLSGRGIACIYDFLFFKNIFKRNAVTHEVNSTLTPDPAAVISKYADNDRACQTAMGLFARFYARALRNFALDCMSEGGIYIAGGIAEKNAKLFLSEDFAREFENNHTRKDLLKRIPVYLITNYNVSLYGAAGVAAFFPERALHK